jgi:hypothetical protein
MTFGLNNAGATYQRAINYIFHELIGKIVEIYIDDIVIKSLDHESHLADVRRTLECTRKHGLKMNPNKCAFGVSVGEFLGFLVHEGGIEVGKKSMKAIDEVVPPTNLKELQSLLGKINFVRRFISNLSQKVLPFSPLLRVKIDQKFVWGDVTPSFKGKTECIDHVCARIKLHTRLDIVNTKISATRIKSYYKP